MENNFFSKGPWSNGTTGYARSTRKVRHSLCSVSRARLTLATVPQMTLPSQGKDSEFKSRRVHCINDKPRCI